MPIGIRDVGAIGHHDTVPNGYLVAARNTHARAEQHAIANRDFSFSLSSAPNANFNALGGLANRSKRMPNVNVITRNIDPPGIHNVGTGTQRGTAWA